MASTEIEFKNSKPKRTGIKGQMDSTKEYLWNPQTKQFMGRTGSSWGKIGLFYLVFYSCLAGFFAACLAVFYQTMGDRMPSQSGMDSLIKGNPGLGYRPIPDVDYTLIKFTRAKNETYMDYIKDLDDFIAAWEANAANSTAKDCSDPNVGDDWDDENDVCAFNISEVLSGACTRAQHYGFFEGEPCILIKMNKVYNWVPEPYNSSAVSEDDEDSQIPEEAGPDHDGKHIKITCEGENEADKDYIGEVAFYPPGGIPVKYFPYLKQDGYQTPFVFAHFKNPKSGMLMQVWCKAWAKNIKHHKNDKAGSVHFELLID
jgi:sodium/potassium-transporting ATPase subunit beta